MRQQQRHTPPAGFNSWRDYIEQLGCQYGLMHEALLEYDWAVSAGEAEHLAAQRAIQEWRIE